MYNTAFLEVKEIIDECLYDIGGQQERIIGIAETVCYRLCNTLMNNPETVYSSYEELIQELRTCMRSYKYMSI